MPFEKMGGFGAVLLKKTRVDLTKAARVEDGAGSTGITSRTAALNLQFVSTVHRQRRYHARADAE